MKYFAYPKVSANKRYFLSDLQKANVLTILSKIKLEKHDILQVNLSGSLEHLRGWNYCTFNRKVFSYQWCMCMCYKTEIQILVNTTTIYYGACFVVSLPKLNTRKILSLSVISHYRQTFNPSFKYYFYLDLV